MFIYLSVSNALFVDVSVVPRSGQSDTFRIDTKYKNKIFLKFDGNTAYITLLIRKDWYHKEEKEPAIDNLVQGWLTYLGQTLNGISSHRQSEFKNVLSDGVEKSMIMTSHDVFSGSIEVEKDNLNRALYTLANATQGDYIFHAGLGSELFDQYVFLGKLEYQSPIEHPDYFEIGISGQSLSYGVDNPLIAASSTDGYPI